MYTNKISKKQGLYDPSFEHDACGVGFIANIGGNRSNSILKKGLEILINLDHRGGSGSEKNTGDGAGILIHIPHKLFKEELGKQSITLPEPGRYGVGMMFMPESHEVRQEIKSIIESIINDENEFILAWRDVPTDPTSLGDTAKSFMPYFQQLFITPSQTDYNESDFKRKLYIIRKRIENTIIEYNDPKFNGFYIASLSSKTIVYKGMLTSHQLEEFYPDLSNPLTETGIAMVHSRFSTNTFPSWERAHPNRYIAHNGEINTLRGNMNWMHAREAIMESKIFGNKLKSILPVIDDNGSDSSMFDNALEFLVQSGYSIPHAMVMMIPEPWSGDNLMDDNKRAFYQYHSSLMEPWDGPASIPFTDGDIIGAALDRNGLRPSRYYVTKDNHVIMASEAGVIDVAPENVLYKGRLKPGRIFLVDTLKGRIVDDREIKDRLINEHPYKKWLNDNIVNINDISITNIDSEKSSLDTVKLQKIFGYTYEELNVLVKPMVETGAEPLGSMGVDSPLAVLSDKPQPLYNYFKQLFAQVTNPPIDAIREEIVVSTETTLGPEGNLLEPGPENCRQIRLNSPILSEEELLKLKNINNPYFKSIVVPVLFKAGSGGPGLEGALNDLFERVDKAVLDGYNIIILSDRGMNEEYIPIPPLLASAGLHHHLIRQGNRPKIGLVLESGDPREVHHFALLTGYGMGAICPYGAYDSIEYMINNNNIVDISLDEAKKNYSKAVLKGIVKILSKMGISTIQSYRGAQIFEAIGISTKVIDKYFTGTPSRIEGINLDNIATEAEARHKSAFERDIVDSKNLDSGGVYRWRKDGEYHMFNPETVYKLQKACRTNDYVTYKVYADSMQKETQRLCTIRGLMDFKLLNQDQGRISIDEVESEESIMKRFKTGAMSYGSISKEAHECLAIAMNRIGGRSNTGEGGEDPARFTPDSNGDSRLSKIKQVASGRFGVTGEYLTNAIEIQIKMAQGAKPGEGGQLPGHKVYPWIAKVRHSTPGVGLISPPPHHDIYSIEDLAQLIHDLKNANPDARISVKLVSEVGVGTIAAGVAKARADLVLISGYDGGTGASPLTSIRHAGLPWELGLAETHQTLMLNNLRSRIVVETDGKLMTGRDVAIAALLGAEEFGFSTAPLITLGCLMMRVCHKDTCPVGVATQSPKLRANFKGKPEYVVNFMRFIARDLREIMAQLGFRTLNEMIGHTDRLKIKDSSHHLKAKGVDLSSILYNPKESSDNAKICTMAQEHQLDQSLDKTVLQDIVKPAVEKGDKVVAELPIKNTNRVVGTIVGSSITKKYGKDGLPEDTIKLYFKGSAGQSFGAFVPKGMTMVLEGDSNDYIAKGLSGGKIIVYPPKGSSFKAHENIIIGNVAFYGATSGEAYISGLAGERFCVRNSGANAVVEGIGDHGCEYMTGGNVVILGSTGKNFGAGMSGGIAYVLDEDKSFKDKCNTEMIFIETLKDKAETSKVFNMVDNHYKYTNSEKAGLVLNNWDEYKNKFVKIIPKDYKRVLQALKRAEEMGKSGDDAFMAAFEENKSKR